ncbi:MAG: TMEM165/GDT1 family protein [Nostochopsis sp.]
MKLDSVPLSAASTSTSIYSQNHGKTAENITSPSPTVADSAQKQPRIAIFATTFLTIFLAEIGDKTQLSTLLMSAESHSPWVVFVGSAAALITTSLLGVLLGSWIANRLSPKTVEKAAGVMLLLISLMLFWDVIH